MEINFWALLFHWFLCLFLCQYHTVLITIDLYYSLKPGCVMAYFFVLFSWLFWLFGVFWSCIQTLGFYDLYLRKMTLELLWIYRRLWVAEDILTILILPIHQHGISFHLLVSSLISFNKILFLLYRLFTSLVKFIPKHFITFDAIVNVKDFLLSFSDVLFLVYRSATDFRIFFFC